MQSIGCSKEPHPPDPLASDECLESKRSTLIKCELVWTRCARSVGIESHPLRFSGIDFTSVRCPACGEAFVPTR